MSVSINRDEWMSALKDAGLHEEGDPESLTVVEFAALVGMKRTAAQRCISGLVNAGTARQTKKRITDSQQRSVLVTSYRLLTPRRGKK